MQKYPLTDCKVANGVHAFFLFSFIEFHFPFLKLLTALKTIVKHFKCPNMETSDIVGCILSDMKCVWGVYTRLQL